MIVTLLNINNISPYFGQIDISVLPRRGELIRVNRQNYKIIDVVHDLDWSNPQVIELHVKPTNKRKDRWYHPKNVEFL